MDEVTLLNTSIRVNSSIKGLKKMVTTEKILWGVIPLQQISIESVHSVQSVQSDMMSDPHVPLQTASCRCEAAAG